MTRSRGRASHRGGRFLVLAVSLLLSACAAVPTTGPVEFHTAQAAGQNSGVKVEAVAPSDGASQTLIVEGFLHAMGSYQPDYAIARQYLTDDAARRWDPTAGVQVYADGAQLNDTGQSIVLSYTLVGRINAAGAYAAANELKPSSHDFALVKNAAGQWRISAPLAGLLVSNYLFSISYLSLNLNFLDTTGTVLVPDPRFFADGDAATVATAQALLDGPTASLAPVVRRIDTTGITVTSVEVNANGTAVIELGGQANRLTTEQRQLLLPEFAHTMTGFDPVSSVEVVSGGSTWSDADGRVVVYPSDSATLVPTDYRTPRLLYAIRDKKVYRQRDAGQWSDLAEVATGLTAPELLAVNGSASEFAAVTASRTRLQDVASNGGKVRELRQGTGLLRPSFARNGELWSLAAGSARQVRVFKGDGELKVDPSALPDAPVVASSVSPDGTRLALVIKRGSGTEVGVAGIVRDGDRISFAGWTTVSLSSVSATASTVRDLGWWTTTEFALLLAGRSSDASVVLVSQDSATGSDIGPGDAGDLERLAVVPGHAAARSASGNVYRYDSDFTWPLALTDVSDLTFGG